MPEREQYRFPTRRYPYRERTAAELMAADAEEEALPSGVLHRFVLGLDPGPRPMTPEEIQALGDPFAGLLLRRGTFPLSLRTLLQALDAHNSTPAGVPNQKVFLVADGGQIPWSPETAGVTRFLRFAVARGSSAEPGILISGSTLLNSDEDFLQVIGWDESRGVFHYYERRLGTWIWAGESHHALRPPTRGKGPFDSHVNGSLVMKELRFPWSHWHSSSAAIQESVLAPDDTLRGEPLFQQRSNAAELEQFIVRPGIRRWGRQRLKEALADPADGSTLFQGVPLFLRQILETTTVNLASAPQESRLIRAEGRVDLPATFFLNTEAFLDAVGLDLDLSPIQVSGAHYLASLERFGFFLTDGSSFRLAGETHFAFLVPEPAFEDLDVLSLLLQEEVLTPRFAAALLMVDFANPTFSGRRARLLRYLPETARRPAGGVWDLETRFAQAVEDAAGEPESPEAEFLDFWRAPSVGWRGRCEARIQAYFDALTARAATQEGVDDFQRLAESRRRRFAGRPLAEFRLTVPFSNIPADAPLLRMRPDAELEPVGEEG